MVLLLVKGFAVIVAFPCITILLTNAAPSVRILGTLNGFATTFSGMGRAIGPTAAGATFSWGVKRGYILPSWWLLAIIAVGQAIPAWMIVEGDGPSREVDTDEDEDEESLLEAADDTDEEGLLRTGGPELIALKDDEEAEDSEFPPLARVSSQAPKPSPGSGGYGTIDDSMARRRPVPASGN